MALPKIALVTGYGFAHAYGYPLNTRFRCTPGGIGHALAKELRQRGLKVIATGRTLEKIAGLKELGVDCVALTVDDPKSVAACHEEVVKLLEGKGLDYLVNNAGFGN